MGSLDITESRIETALQRLAIAAEATLNRPDQGTLDIGGEPGFNEELVSLRATNQKLSQELAELRIAYKALKQSTEIVSLRVDNTINNLCLLLES
ncbi:MAG: hypothetical protein JKY12_00470 [Sneathiella sp.]|nr:hypothetical protein [Sneathiella sp.]